MLAPVAAPVASPALPPKTAPAGTDKPKVTSASGMPARAPATPSTAKPAAPPPAPSMVAPPVAEAAVAWNDLLATSSPVATFNSTALALVSFALAWAKVLASV
eukprot:UN04355